MRWFRNHWFDVGGILALIIVLFVWCLAPALSAFQMLLWLHLAALLLHQVEEYRYPGTFPGMLNVLLFHSKEPRLYPLQANTAMCINTFAWLLYLLTALCHQHAVWLGMITIFISAGNVLAHSFLFNLKGKTWYNAGMLSSWLCFVPCIYWFFIIIYRAHLVNALDYWVAVPLGLLANASIIVAIKWLARKNNPYPFPERNMLPA